MLAPLLAVALAADPAGLHLQSQLAPGDEEYVYEDEEGGGPRRLRLGAWGGTLYDVDDGDWIPFTGGEASWAFRGIALGLFGGAYRFGRERADSEWGPVILARLEQRFEAGRGVEAVLGFGAGAAREDGWTPWFQFGFGFRLLRGPLFVGGELGFEQDNLFRLGATAGLVVF